MPSLSVLLHGLHIDDNIDRGSPSLFPLALYAPGRATSQSVGSLVHQPNQPDGRKPHDDAAGRTRRVTKIDSGYKA
jgi:hypothetical protein